MRILMIAPMPPQPQPSNGVPLVTLALLHGLSQHHDVTLATLAGPDVAEHQAVQQLTNEGFRVHAVLRHAGQQRVQIGLRMAGSVLGGTEPLRSGWYWDARFQRLITQLLTTNNFDIVQLDDNALGAYTFATQRPIVMTEHEVRRPRPINWRALRTAGLMPGIWREEQWRRWAGYQRRVWRRAQRLVVFTQEDAQAMTGILPAIASRVRVNPFGLVLPGQANPTLEVPNTLLFVGGYSHYPNCDAAIWLAREIMPLVRSLRPGVQLRLIGDAPPPELQALASDDVIVAGRVPQIEPWIERASLVLAPVRIGGGMRTKVLQAMAMGKSVVSTSLGALGLQRSVPPPLAIANTAMDMANIIVRLLEDAEQRQRLGQQARAFVQQYHSAEAYARRMEYIYSELLAMP